MIALLIEAPVGGNAADVARFLQFAQRHREGGGESLLLALRAQVADRLAGGFPQSVGIQWTFLKSGNHGVRKLVDFLFGYSEFHGGFHLAVESAPRRQPEGEVLLRQDVSAATSAWQLIDFERLGIGVGLFAADSGARKQS